MYTNNCTLSLIMLWIFLGILVYGYAIAGVELFSHIAYGRFITPYANFSSFSYSFVTLFRLFTGAYWNGIMRDCQGSPPLDECENSENNASCGPYSYTTAYVFFVSFMLISAFLIFNVFIAILFSEFKKAILDVESPASIDDIENFVQEWSLFNGRNLLIDCDRIGQFLLRVRSPLGYLGSLKKFSIRQAHDLQIPLFPDDKNKLHFYDVLEACMANAFRKKFINFSWDEIPPDNLDNRQLFAIQTFKYPELRPERFEFLLAHRMSAQLIWKSWKGFKSKTERQNNLKMKEMEKMKGTKNARRKSEQLDDDDWEEILEGKNNNHNNNYDSSQGSSASVDIGVGGPLRRSSLLRSVSDPDTKQILNLNRRVSVGRSALLFRSVSDVDEDSSFSIVDQPLEDLSIEGQIKRAQMLLAVRTARVKSLSSVGTVTAVTVNSSARDNNSTIPQQRSSNADFLGVDGINHENEETHNVMMAQSEQLEQMRRKRIQAELGATQPFY